VQSEELSEVTKEIVSKLGSILGVRVYVAVADRLGNLILSDRELDQFNEFMSSFVKSNFKYLKVGDHSMPISGKNIMFFRISDKAMVIIYSAKGRVGQLLSFKSLMPKYQNIIDKFVRDIEPEPISVELEVEKVLPASVAIPAVPVRTVEKKVFSRKMEFFKEIYPKVTKKLKDSAKFSLTISVILNYSNGNNSFSDLFDKVNISYEEFIDEFYRLYKAKMVETPDYELVQGLCPNCKKIFYQFVPNRLLDVSPKGILRFQPDSPEDEHTFYVLYDKKRKMKPKTLPKFRAFQDEIDFSNLSVEKLIKFFGQDVFFNIFHAIFFKYSVIFLMGTDLMAQIGQINNYMNQFFGDKKAGESERIIALSREEYIKQSKKYEDCLVIDLHSNIVINEPYETEDLDFELRLFKKVLQEKEDKSQILKTYSEFERLVLATDTILTEIEMYKEINEDELIELMKTKHKMQLERSEIPIIKELADIYYSIDIRKKIIKTLVGRASDFFQSF